MGTFIVIYLLTVLCGYLLSVLFAAIRYFPAVLFYTILLPVLPFHVAYKNRKEHPAKAKIIYALWGAVYLGLLFILCMNLCMSRH